MRAEVRHQLKQDRFSQVTIEAAEKTVSWSVAHKASLIAAGIVAVLVGGAVAAGWYYLDRQDQQASLAITQGLRTLDTQLRAPGTPAQPEFPTFASAQERATEARKQFQEVIDKYPHTRSAQFARYYLGLTEVDLGNAAGATQDFQAAANSRNADLASLAEFALASLDRSQNRDREAIQIYNQLISKPTATVAKVTAQIALAETYVADNQPAEASRLYQLIQKENPSTDAAQLATEKLQALK